MDVIVVVGCAVVNIPGYRLYGNPNKLIKEGRKEGVGVTRFISRQTDRYYCIIVSKVLVGSICTPLTPPHEARPPGSPFKMPLPLEGVPLAPGAELAGAPPKSPPT